MFVGSVQLHAAAVPPAALLGERRRGDLAPVQRADGELEAPQEGLHSLRCPAPPPAVSRYASTSRWRAH